MTTHESLKEARARHDKAGGFLLDLGGGVYAVCDEGDALCMRSAEQLEALAPTYSEAG